jgi:hypothetical protein
VQFNRRKSQQPAILTRNFTESEIEMLAQSELMQRIDLTTHNEAYRNISFSNLISKAPTERHCHEDEFEFWSDLIRSGSKLGGKTRWYETFPEPANRKLWEWALILETARISNTLKEGKRALGFAVGQEPIPAILAKYGVSVLASDKHTEQSDAWIHTKEHMNAVQDLLLPEVVDNEILVQKVNSVHIDMNHIPLDLGKFDFIWSSCAIEHLGSPEKGLEFVMKSIEMLEEGGVAIHTTELELTQKNVTADYGNCAIYRLEDLKDLEERVRQRGFKIELNTSIDMSTPKDRWISRIPLVGVDKTKDLAHLKLAIADSISTSFSIVVQRN